ncbi:hypothetical protein [Pseudoroseomonas sp. WGS1072]|uniref:hypothetical protein n=1 Tax=Roseomonas sp. WGS1072 TaxID=3366816 RepID=UPI003BF12841
MNIVDAARNAGFAPNTASRKAYLFIRRPPVAARLRELGTSVEEVRARTSSGARACGPEESYFPVARIHRRASVALEAALTAAAVPEVLPAVQTALAPVLPTDTPRLSEMGSDAVRNWLIDFLTGVAEDARAKHDRRAAIAASAEIARLHALHARQTDPGHGSVLDRLTGQQLLLLHQLLEQDGGSPVIDGDAEEAEAGGQRELAVAADPTAAERTR